MRAKWLFIIGIAGLLLAAGIWFVDDNRSGWYCVEGGRGYELIGDAEGGGAGIVEDGVCRATHPNGTVVEVPLSEWREWEAEALAVLVLSLASLAAAAVAARRRDEPL
jgi:hypothetical protein